MTHKRPSHKLGPSKSEFLSNKQTNKQIKQTKVVDIYQQPHLAKGKQIIVAPTLIKKLPLPLRRLIGDMSDTERFLVGLDLKSKES